MSKNKKKKKYEVGDIVRFVALAPLTFTFGIISEIDDECITVYTLPDKADMFMTPKAELEKKYKVKDFEKLLIKDYGKHVVLFMHNITVHAEKHVKDLSVMKNSYPATINMSTIADDMFDAKAIDAIHSMIKGIDPKYKIYIVIEDIPYKVKLKNDKVFIDGNPVVE